MGHASIDISARQSKAIQQQIFDSLKRNESQQSLSTQLAQTLSAPLPTFRSSAIATRFGRRTIAPFRRYRVCQLSIATSNPNSEMLGHVDTANREFKNKEISQEEINREIERQKRLGAMSEIAPAALVSSVRSDIQSAFLYNSPIKPDENSQHPNIKPDLGRIKRRPYWFIAGIASTWLVHSMAQALGGGVWNYMISASLDYAPMLLIGARVNPETQKIAIAGAVGIFLLGLVLYLAPSLQTVINEYSAYLDASKRYSVELSEYNTKNSNAAALRDRAKNTSDDSDRRYKEILKKYGEQSWRTVAAKKTKDSDFNEWKHLSEAVDKAQMPIPPKISDELRKAAQTIGLRVGLFAVVFLSMFVMHRLEPERSA